MLASTERWHHADLPTCGTCSRGPCSLGDYASCAPAAAAVPAAAAISQDCGTRLDQGQSINARQRYVPLTRRFHACTLQAALAAGHTQNPRDKPAAKHQGPSAAYDVPLTGAVLPRCCRAVPAELQHGSSDLLLASFDGEVHDKGLGAGMVSSSGADNLEAGGRAEGSRCGAGGRVLCMQRLLHGHVVMRMMCGMQNDTAHRK